MLSSIPPLQDDEEDVSYDIESLFTNIPIEETINYITDQIYVHRKLTPICSKLIFTFSFSFIFFDECTAKCVHVSPQKKECTSFIFEGTVKWTHLT